MSSAETIRRIRLSMCYEQSEFGNLIGVSKQSVSNYETGLRMPRLPVIRKIMDVAKKHKIKVEVEDFLPKSTKEDDE